MFYSDERVGRWITTLLHFQEMIIVKLFQVHKQVQYSATGLTAPGVVKTLLSTSHLGLVDSEGDSL